MESTQFLIEKFTDFEKKEHQFTLCATVVRHNSKPENLEINGVIGLHPCTIMFGVSFCNPKDVIKEELGKKIAYNKALNSKTRIAEVTCSSSMLISTDYINMCLKRLSEVISKHPENFSVSYAKALLRAAKI